jgi:tRNA G46 methylase TrmB
MNKNDFDEKGVVNWNNSYLLEKEDTLWGNDEVPIMERVCDIFSKNGGKKFLYIPCGDGRNLLTLSKRLSYVIGADSSENALEIAERKIEQFKLENIVLLKNDIFIRISVFSHNPVILAIISLSKSLSPKYLRFSL